MGDVTFSGAAGVYHVENNTLAFVIEPEDGTYNTKLTTSGSATIKFSADATISDEPLSKALNASDLANAVSLANVFNLPSHDDYLAFQTAQKAAVFRVNIAAES